MPDTYSPYEPMFDFEALPDIEITPSLQGKLDRAQEIIGYRFNRPVILSIAITHPSAVEGKPRKYSYERLEFLGDSILGAIVATTAFHEYHNLDEGGLTRIKVALVSGTSLSNLAEGLGFADVIVFGSSEAGTNRRGLHSALENVYEAVVAALFLDGGISAAFDFVYRTLIPNMNVDMAKEPENPKSALQEKLQEEGITPTYKLVDTQGPPHNRTFVAQVYAGDTALAKGEGRTKKEAESQAAKSTLARLSEFFELLTDSQVRAEKAAAKAQAQVEKAAAKAQAQVDTTAAKAKAHVDRAIAEADRAKAKAEDIARKRQVKSEAALASEDAQCI